ncbi:DUF2189 domain-containing protein [Kiloniella litopenaei]|uniref:DUF2189 domain-containing protein n=1 Tax=Kiloniella litopenaei TaxID=1549748 RepID=UPI000698D827|nr:DUF2189 domain-containing protein [Kiloniella litopenaei]
MANNSEGINPTNQNESQSIGDNSAVKKRNPNWPDVYQITPTIIPKILRAGISDFLNSITYGLFFGGIYAVGGWILILLLLELELPYLVYPLAIGFALIAPFVASGFYFISHQLEEKQPLSWGRAFGVVASMFNRDLGWMALVTGFSLFIWLDMAAFITLSFFGFKLFSMAELLDMILTTEKGLLFLFVGHVVGAIIALIVFSFSAVSFPMLYHRDIDFVTAMVTSVRLVKNNPKTMILWCITIAALTLLSIVVGLMGLFVTLPVLGHATWHLYKRAVGPSPLSHPNTKAL